MINFTKNNWFRIAVIIVILFAIYVLYRGLVVVPEQSTLSHNQELCREAGAKNDQEIANAPTDFSYRPQTIVSGYYYNPNLNTCLEAYNIDINKNTSPTIKDDTEIMGYGIADLYNGGVEILTCEDDYSPSQNIYDIETIKENKSGLGLGDSKDTVFSGKDKDFSECAKFTSSLTGGEFVAGERF